MDWAVPAGVTRLVLVRHGETEVASRGIIAGRLDPALSARGVDQAWAAAARLAPARLAAVYSSPSRRALESARPIAEPRGLAPIRDAGLLEIDFGVLEGLTFEEASVRHPDVAAAWLSRPHEIVFPGGESLQDVRDRALRSVAAIVARHPSAAVALVCHAGPIRLLIAEALGLAQERVFDPGCAPGSVTVLDAHERLRTSRRAAAWS